jgi:DNA-binding HxlR family transcriptional regulator
MPPGRRTNPISDCPLTAAIAAIGGKWKLIILFWLAESPKQFGELRQRLPSVSQKVLTEQLRELIADDIISRKRTGRVPAPVLYSLTDYGHSLVPLVEAVRRWGRGHIEHFESAADAQAAPADSLP